MVKYISILQIVSLLLVFSTSYETLTMKVLVSEDIVYVVKFVYVQYLWSDNVIELTVSQKCANFGYLCLQGASIKFVHFC